MTISSLKKRWIAIIAVVIGSLSLAGCFHGKSHHRGGEMMFEYVAWKLDLNDEQQALMDDVKAELKKARKDMHEQRKQDKQAVIALIEAETLDTEAAMSIFNKKQAAINEHAPAVLEKIAALHATLTPEQKAKVIAKLNSMGKHHE
ncbi:MAG: Spy/CpxP family protein refolding chaperone [Pseudomonadales bacterium]|nr:Spy/CpxP family protein refolding chaperone [Pseudomonadales bacterium]